MKMKRRGDRWLEREEVVAVRTLRPRRRFGRSNHECHENDKTKPKKLKSSNRFLTGKQ